MARINIGGDYVIRGVATPENANDAVNKDYVDTRVGAFIEINDWSPSSTYDANDIVIYSGFLYRATTDVASSTGTTNNPDDDPLDQWELISVRRLGDVDNVNVPAAADLVAGAQYTLVYDDTDEDYTLEEIVTELKTWDAATTYNTNDAVVYNEYLYRLISADSVTGGMNPEDDSEEDTPNWQRVSVRNFGDLQDIDTSDIIVGGANPTSDGTFFTTRWRHAVAGTRDYNQLEVVESIGIIPWVSGITYDEGSFVTEDGDAIYYRTGDAVTLAPDTGISPTPAENEIQPKDAATGWLFIAGPSHDQRSENARYTIRAVDDEANGDAEDVLEGDSGMPNLRNNQPRGQFSFWKGGGPRGDGRRVLRFNVEDEQSPDPVSLRNAFNLIFDDATVPTLRFVFTLEGESGRKIEYETVGNDQTLNASNHVTVGTQIWRGDNPRMPQDGADSSQYAFIVNLVAGQDFRPGDVGSGNILVQVFDDHKNVTRRTAVSDIAGGHPNDVLTTDSEGNAAWALVNTDNIKDRALTTAKVDSDEPAAATTAGETVERYLQVSTDDAGAHTLSWETIEEQNNLIFSDLDSNNQRTLEQYHNGTETEDIRSVAITGDEFVLTFAHFDPTFTAASQNLNWDDAPRAITTTVTNNDDYFDDYLSSIQSITITGGDTDSPFTTGFTYNPDPVARPTATVNQWTGTFTPDATDYIRPAGTTLAGETLTGQVSYNVTDVDGNESAYTGNSSFNITWATASRSFDITPIAQADYNIFLEPYTEIGFTSTVTGLSDTSRSTRAFTPSTNVNNISNTFTNLSLYPGAAGVVKSMDSVFTRPSILGSAAQTVNQAQITRTITHRTHYDFDYPRIWMFSNTDSSDHPTDNTDWVHATNPTFAAGVEQLDTSGNTFVNEAINNDVTGDIPQVFWLGVRTSETNQPNKFEVASVNAAGRPGLFNTTEHIDLANTITLTSRDTSLTGFTGESYTFYGITLQPGMTYVRITHET